MTKNKIIIIIITYTEKKYKIYKVIVFFFKLNK